MNAYTFLAALGWALLFALAYHYIRLTRAARAWRLMSESLLREHDPEGFARYVRRLAARGELPLIPPTKES